MTYLTEAFGNLIATKLRTLLAMIGILVGTASVVAMVSSGQLATKQALAQFKSLGTDMLSLSLYPQANNSDNNTNNLDPADISKLSETIPAINTIAPYSMTYMQANYKDQTIEASIIGTTQSLAKTIKITMAKGRFISDLDNYANYCVIGQKIYQNLQANMLSDPIGQQIKIGDNYFTIVGVADHWQENNFFSQDINNTIIIPIKTSLTINKYVNISHIVLRLKPDANITLIKSQLTQQLVGSDPNKKIFFRSAKELIKSMTAQHKIFTWLLGLIGSISLIVGGIGVMNIMLVSVLERRREIGIRLALGARRKDIQWMFLSESVVLSVVGGIIGIILGIVTSFVVAKLAHWDFTLLLWPPFVGFTVSVMIGVFSGYYPALKAAQLDPIETLRIE